MISGWKLFIIWSKINVIRCQTHLTQYLSVELMAHVRWFLMKNIHRIQWFCFLDTFLDDQHPILTAFLRAYNSHEDIILSVDDIWLMICIYFANYINSNGHGLTHLYVDHQTNNVLTVENEQAEWVTIEGRQLNSSIAFSFSWFYFLHQVRCQMNDRIKPDAYHLLSNNFSTTNEIESLLSSIAMMSIFKKVSPSNRSIHSCGIRNVHFTGQLHDWILLRDKIIRLQQWTRKDDDFFLYIDGLKPILNEFIETYQGNVNQLFWDRIFDLDHQNGQSRWLIC